MHTIIKVFQYVLRITISQNADSKAPMISASLVTSFSGMKYAAPLFADASSCM